MAWEVEYTDEFEEWNSLGEPEQASVGTAVEVLAGMGPALSFPRSSRITTSRHAAMRELRIQHHGRPYRVLYAFDARRAALLILGGDKTGNDRWYEQNVPLADVIYDRYLQQRKQEQDNAKNT